MRALAPLLLLLAVVPSVACGAPDDEGDDGDDTEDALIGGHPGALAKFPSTVYLKGTCTAAKVAPKTLLTAAHCVVDPATVDLKYKAGSKLSITRDPAKGYAVMDVADVQVHPSWISGCNTSFCGASSVTAKLDAADVAIIHLVVDDDIPVTPIDSTALAVSDRVTVVGFGCTVGVLSPDTRDIASLKYANTRLVDDGKSVHVGSPITNADLARVGGLYAMTLGPGAAKAKAGLCPGDSGGPLYASRGGHLVVVGVNSNYTLAPDTEDATGLPITNWHTRLDDGSHQKVGDWLRSVGVFSK